MCEILDLIRVELKRQYGHLSNIESPLPAASLHIAPSSLPLLPLVDAHTGLSSCVCNNCPYREKDRVDPVSSLEGELFSGPLSSCASGILFFVLTLCYISYFFIDFLFDILEDMSNCMSMQPYPFGPFNDLSTMFATQ